MSRQVIFSYNRERRKLTYTQKIIITVIIIIVLYALAIAMIKKSKPTVPFSYSQEQINLQPDRERFLQKLVSENIILKYDDRGDFLRLYVTQRFINTDYDTKKVFLNAILAFYAINKNIPAEDYFIIIQDSRSGKEIGNYTHGLLKMD